MTSDIWLASVVAGEDLDHESAKFAMSHIMDGVASPEWIKSLILALKEKGETPTEVAGFVAAMMDLSPSVVISGISLISGSPDVLMFCSRRAPQVPETPQ